MWERKAKNNESVGEEIEKGSTLNIESALDVYIKVENY